MKIRTWIFCLAIVAVAAGCGSGQRKVNKSEAQINKERVSLIEDYKKCIKKAGEDEAKAAACERYREAADSLSK